MVTDQGNVTSQLLMTACARSATKRRGQQKQILWDALHRRIPASNVRGRAPTEARTEVSACPVLNREGELDRPLSKLTTTVFLLCLAAAIPLALAEYCSGGDDPNAPMESL